MSDMKTSLTKRAALLAALAASLAAFTAPGLADPLQPAEAVAPMWRTDVTGTRTDIIPLLRLVPGGTAQSVRLTGLTRTQGFDFGVRPDEVVSEATLDLRFTPSPALSPTVSQVNVYLNGQLQQSVPLWQTMIGKESSLRFTLNPKAVKSRNTVAVEFIGHYPSPCENPANDALWLNISPDSRLTLVRQRLRLANDLGQFPAPFVDTVTGMPTVLPVAFAGAPDAKEKQAAAILASQVGVLTEWRGANFPVYYNEAPSEGHFVVFATNAHRPAFLKDLPPLDGPQVVIADAPGAMADKMLIIAGRNGDDLITAVKALGSRGLVMIGDRFRVKAVKEDAPAKAYDAPRWVATGTPVPFTKLMQYPGQLSASGYMLSPVHLPLRLAPDLYTVGDSAVTMQVKYRYSKPIGQETAQFRAYVNGYLADSHNLSRSDGTGTRTVRLPGFYGELINNRRSALTLAPLNDLSFTVGYERLVEGGSKENCKSAMLLSHQMEIEPSSTIELHGLYHYAELPNIALYTQSGFPFTKYADLQETAVLIRPDASSDEVTTMLNAVARMSAVTGAQASRLAVAESSDSPLLGRRDVLAIGHFPELLGDINDDTAKALQRSVVSEAKSSKSVFAGTERRVMAEGVAGIVSAESPFASGRTVVALLSDGPAGSVVLNRELVNPASLGQVKGAVAIVGESETVDFKGEGSYVVGDLPWYHRIWMQVIDHPALLVACALLSALILGFGIFAFMRLWIRRRAS